jgi:hypothetical protein
VLRKPAAVASLLTGLAISASRLPLPQLRLLTIVGLVALLLFFLWTLAMTWMTRSDWVRLGPIEFGRRDGQYGRPPGDPGHARGARPRRRRRRRGSGPARHRRRRGG